jgi:hypothetical protein
MGLAKRGSRTISVNNDVYRWVISPDDGFMQLVVELAEDPGQRLIATYLYDDDPETGRPLRQITPRSVRQVIEISLKQGWQPRAPGRKPFRLCRGESVVEPLNPNLRDALKQEHAELTDEVMDRIEELTHQRFEIDPDADPELLRKIDQERERLLRQFMPRYRQVCERVANASGESAGRRLATES